MRSAPLDAAAVVRDRRRAARRTGRRAARRPGSRRCAGRARTGSSRSRPSAARRSRPSSSTSSLRTTSTASTRSSPRIATGETRKRRTIRRGLPAGGRAAYSLQQVDVPPRALAVGLERRLARRRRARGRRGSTITSAPASSPSSFSSGRRERRLHRPAAAEHHDLLARRDAAIAVDRLVGRVGRRELLRGEREHARDVDRDVAVPDHDRALAREVELEVLEVGVAVVPGDERRGRPRAGQVLAGDAEPPVGLRADGVDDRVVEREQLLVRDVAADLDVAEEAEARPRRGLLERARDGLDVLVVGRDAEADEAPRRRQPVDQVDLDLRVLALQQRVGRVEPGRAGADDGDAKQASRARA